MVMNDRHGHGLYLSFFFLFMVVFIALGFHYSPKTENQEEVWARQTWADLMSGSPLKPPPAKSVNHVNLVATYVPLILFGCEADELLRCEKVGFASGAKIDCSFPGVEGFKIIFDRKFSMPYVLSLSEAIVVSDNSESGASVEGAKFKIGSFLNSVSTELTRAIPELGSETFFSHLQILVSPAIFKPHLTDSEAKKFLGPLYKIDKLPKVTDDELPIDSILMGKESSKFPQAYRLQLKGLKITPTPKIDWDEDFKQRLSSTPELSIYADIWEKRQNSLSTWVPQLSDDVGTLLGSGYIRFNHPDVLPTTAKHLFPMDELNLLRAFHAAGIESAPYFWYPRPASLSQALPISLSFLVLYGNQINPSETLEQKIASAPTYCSQMYKLEAGEHVIGDVFASETVILYSLGNLILKGEKPGKPFIIIAEGGDIFVETPKLNAHLICLPTKEKPKSGKIVFRRTTEVTGNLKAREVVLEKEALVKFVPRTNNFSSIPLVLRYSK